MGDKSKKSVHASQSEFNFDAPQKTNALEFTIDTDLVGATIQRIIDEQQHTLPDLSDHWIIISNTNAANEIKRRLLLACSALGYNAILPPKIGSLDDFLSQIYIGNYTLLSDQALELILVSALQDHAHLYADQNPWTLSSNLLELFHQLTLWHVSIPNQVKTFKDHVNKAYGQQTLLNTDALDFESNLVHSLWFALRKQLQTDKQLDRQSARLHRLQLSASQTADKDKIYFIGHVTTFPHLIEWQTRLQHQNKLMHIRHKSPILDLALSNQTNDTRISSINYPQQTFTNTFANALALVYQSESQTLMQRAEQCKLQFPDSPIRPVLTIYDADHAENEARAVDIQVRQWLLQGKQNIAVVTENRKLARRIRALLERANINIQDAAGWPLSTTSAASLLERWLECIELDFHYMSLIDLLKSDFFIQTQHNPDYLQSIYLFEQGIVIEESTTNNIERYINQIHLRQQRLPAQLADGYNFITDLLNKLKTGADIIAPYFNTDTFLPEQCIDAIIRSLKQLNLYSVLSADEAGQRVLDELVIMREACQHSVVQLNWTSFRAWLGSNLERHNFKIPSTNQQVHLLSLAQTDLMQFDAAIICSAEHQHLPRTPEHSPFFNDAVNRALGIPSKYQSQIVEFYFFIQLLLTISRNENTTNAIVITKLNTSNDEEVQACTWVEALQAFHLLAYNDNLGNKHLASIITSGKAYVQSDKFQLPEPTKQHPRTCVPETLLPKSISAHAYQQLVDCPYQFYAARCLKLQPPDVIRDMLQKSDFGERIHLTLQAFHMQVNAMPSPFNEKITSANQSQAIQKLIEISQIVFRQDVEDNFLHRGWLQQWLELVPKYIEWQIKQQSQWDVACCELHIKDLKISETLSLNGRIDRIDKAQQGLCITDYKTGRVPAMDEVINGESIQLPFYAFLLEKWIEQDQELNNNDLQNPDHQSPDHQNKSRHDVMMFGSDTHPVKVQYLQLTKQRTGSLGNLEGSELSTIAFANLDRLISLTNDLHQGLALPAWGDENVCKHCHAEGLCRKSQWV